MPHQESSDAYHINLINAETSLDATLSVGRNEVIMDIAEQAGIELPVSCRAGACTSCVGRLIDGTVGHQHSFLKREEEAAGFILTCTAYPLSDCTILTHQEEALLELFE